MEFTEIQRIINSVNEENPLVLIHGYGNDVYGDIGVFTSSFDPLHIGHEEIIHMTSRYYGIKRTFIILSKNHVLNKTCVAPLEHRIAMVMRVYGSDNRYSIFLSNDGRYVEMGHQLHLRCPDCSFYFNMGFDSFEVMATERLSGNTLQELVKFRDTYNCHVKIVIRGMMRSRDTELVLDNNNKRDWMRSVDLFQIDDKYNYISSTLARERLKAKRSVNNILSPTVAQYIRDNNLYK